MKKFFAYKGNLDLDTAKIKKIDNTKFHLNSIDIAKKRCNRIWGEGNYNLYIFENFNDNKTFLKID